VIAITTILVATDFSESSDTALRYGKDLARTHGATLHVLNVADDLGVRLAATPLGTPPDLGRFQSDLEAEARRGTAALLTDEDRQVLRARSVVLTSSRPADAIVSYARDVKADLIVMGTHGRSGLAHLFMGSVAQQVVRAAPCPVLTVRHPEREFIRPDALQVISSAQ